MKLEDLMGNKTAMDEINLVSGDVMRRVAEWQASKLEEVTREEIAKIMAQLVCSGDFMHICAMDAKGKVERYVDYVPYREKARLEAENKRLREVLRGFWRQCKACENAGRGTQLHLAKTLAEHIESAYPDIIES